MAFLTQVSLSFFRDCKVHITVLGAFISKLSPILTLFITRVSILTAKHRFWILSVLRSEFQQNPLPIRVDDTLGSLILTLNSSLSEEGSGVGWQGRSMEGSVGISVFHNVSI